MRRALGAPSAALVEADAQIWADLVQRKVAAGASFDLWAYQGVAVMLAGRTPTYNVTIVVVSTAEVSMGSFNHQAVQQQLHRMPKRCRGATLHCCHWC